MRDAISPRKRLRSNEGRSLQALSTGENEENSSGSATVAAPAIATTPAMIFKLQPREVKYDESMTPNQWFQEWARMFLVAYEGTHVGEQYQMACMINALKRKQLQQFSFRSSRTRRTSTRYTMEALALSSMPEAEEAAAETTKGPWLPQLFALLPAPDVQK